MVCSKCEKQLKAQEGTKVGVKAISKGKTGERKVGINMLLEKRKQGFNPAAANCQKCKKRLNSDDKYCNLCAYQEGKCKMCGVKILSTDTYRQSVH